MRRKQMFLTATLFLAGSITMPAWVTNTLANRLHHVASAQTNTGIQTHGQSSITTPVVPFLPPIGEEAAESKDLHYLLAQRTTNYHHANESQAKNMEVLAKRLNGTVVQPGEIFSYYKTVGPYTQENGFYWGRAFQGDRIVPSMGGGVCQGASTLYSALLRTDLKIIERHHHSLTVPYLPPGEDATVASTYLNFRFQNTREDPIYIAAATDSNKKLLTVALWGAEPSPTVKVRHDILQVYPFSTIQKHELKLAKGETKVLSPGQAGVKAHTWIQRKTDDGWETQDKGIDTYKPSPRIILVP